MRERGVGDVSRAARGIVDLVRGNTSTVDVEVHVYRYGYEAALLGKSYMTWKGDVDPGKVREVMARCGRECGVLYVVRTDNCVFYLFDGPDGADVDFRCQWELLGVVEGLDQLRRLVSRAAEELEHALRCT